MKILSITYNEYPNGDAAAVRQHILSKLFKNIGHEVFNIGMGTYTGWNIKYFDGTPYISFRNKKNNYFAKLNNYFGYGYNLKKFFITMRATFKFDIILVRGIPLNALMIIKHYCKKNNIKLLHDSVEWYSSCQFKLSVLSIEYIIQNLYNKYFIDKSFKVIAISSYLEKHFLSRGLQTIRIPVILDVDNAKFEKNIARCKLTLIYAGSPGKKDYIKEILEALNMLGKEELKKVELRLIGITKKQLIKSCGVSLQTVDMLENSLSVVGRISHDEVLCQLEKADFSVLLRPTDKRYAKAGFPTKVVESLAHATPVICNLTSDLGDYIKDGENGLVVDECSAMALYKTIQRALKLNEQEKTKMQKKARQTAEENFDYRLYLDKIPEILEEKL